MGKYEKALVEYQQALEVLPAVHGQEHLYVANYFSNVACTYEEALGCTRNHSKSGPASNAPKRPKTPQNAQKRPKTPKDAPKTPVLDVFWAVLGVRFMIIF